MISMLFLILAALVSASDDPPDNGKLKGKNPIYENLKQNNLFGGLGDAPGNLDCIEKCIERNQMASVAFKAIQEQCHQKCSLDDIFEQVRSQDIPEYENGVKALCEIDDPRAVQPLITALKRDIKARTGLWARIIPALGKLRDSAAVSVLAHTLTLNNEHWLGNKMSAHALGDIGAPESIPVLLEAVWRGDIRGPVIQALAKFNDHRVIPTLISALQPDEDPEATQAAITALHRFGSGAVPELIDAFDDFSPEYSETQKRLRLCHLLGQSGDKRAIVRLHESLKDPDTTIKKCASAYVDDK